MRKKYVHKGFFELNTVVALVLPMLLMADSMLIRKSKMGLYTFRALAGTQIALVLVILGSALMRMGLYQAEFGQSELRLYVTVFMGWQLLAKSGHNRHQMAEKEVSDGCAEQGSLS